MQDNKIILLQILSKHVTLSVIRSFNKVSFGAFSAKENIAFVFLLLEIDLNSYSS